MLPPDARTLSGEVASPQHLAELRLPADGLVLPHSTSPTPGHLLLFCLQGCIACFHAELAWHLEAQHFVWLTPTAATNLRPATTRPSDLLVWRFTATALPVAIHPLLPAPSRTPAHGPAPLTPSMQTLLLGLRGCPVAPALRNIWGTGKLIELLTLLLPPPADPAPAQAQSRVLHPALRAVIDYMTAHLAEPIGLPEMAAAVHSSPSHLSRLFTAEFGHGPTIHLRRLRLDHAAALLRSGQANVTEAALAAGYQSLGQFSRAFSEHHGRPPSALIPRNNG
ncbi:MAG: AraC family transcriptional regulator [Rariglobus sp.]|jgi:AraC-like DNA-binding protein|nr:AraC family transcriptional regulator [Rariglobus sp.]